MLFGKITEAIFLVNQLAASRVDYLTSGQLGSLDYLGNKPGQPLFFWPLAVLYLHVGWARSVVVLGDTLFESRPMGQTYSNSPHASYHIS